MAAFRTRATILTLSLALISCAPQTPPPHEVTATPISYRDMREWDGARIEESLAHFRSVCPQGVTDKGKGNHFGLTLPRPQQWQRLCDAAQRTGIGKRVAQQFFETYFTPHRIHGMGRSALYTGYYIPVLRGSLSPSETYRWPVYGLPPELAASNGFFTRRQIDEGALEGRGLEIAWVDDPVALFFAQVQGSARMRLPDGRVVLLQYAGKNGQPYVAIGRVLVERGELAKETVSLRTIKRWMMDHPDQATALMHENPSYVFFRRVDQAPAITGAHGTPLKAEYSLATDPSYLPLGLPLLVDTTIPDPMEVEGVNVPFRRVMVAQDVGTAITGPLRGDIYFGEGKEAEYLAGNQRAEGSIILFWPKAP